MLNEPEGVEERRGKHFIIVRVRPVDGLESFHARKELDSVDNDGEHGRIDGQLHPSLREHETETPSLKLLESTLWNEKQYAPPRKIESEFSDQVDANQSREDCNSFEDLATHLEYQGQTV